MKIIVGMADMRVTREAEATLISYALGSCIGVTVHDPVAKVGGMLHFMLPDSQIDPQKAQKNPWMFANTGLPLFFREAYKLGAEKKRLQVKVIGGSQVMDDSGFFSIGKRNYKALREIFGMNNVPILAEDVGGCVNRTIRLEINTGRVWVKASGEGEKEL
jgi:chemotaxis protein CheD